MFVGHYGPSYAIKAFRPALPLWVLFIAVQLIDVAWAVFVMLGIEKVRVVPGFMAASPLDLYYMPYTHSLLGCLAWSVAAWLVCRWLLPVDARPAAAWVGVAVFSHWVLDLIVHGRDLAIYDDTLKVGFGLWNYPIPAFVAEAVVLCTGLYVYMRRTRPLGVIGRVGPPLFVALLLAIQAYSFVGPVPTTSNAEAFTALAAYGGFALIAGWLSRHRVSVAERAG